MLSISAYRSPEMKRIVEQLRAIAGSNVPILLEGETGTGKNILARQIHDMSGRNQGDFVTLLCGSLPLSLVESELFGHEAGAFTGAYRHKQGLIEAADTGTLYLDEIENLPAATQAKLLRVLEERKLRRVGAVTEIGVSFRLICANNLNLKALAEKGAFRLDLFYRVAGYRGTIPPLHQRPEDILPLARHILSELGENRKPTFRLSKAAQNALLDYDWPGNIRELRNALRLASYYARDGLIDAAHLETDAGSNQGTTKTESLAAIEQEHIANVWKRNSYNRAKTAKILGITATTLRRKIKKYGLAAGEASARDKSPAAD